MIDVINKMNDHHIIEKDDILKIIADYISKNNLEKYLCDVVFSSETNHLAHYNISTNKVVLNDDRIINSCYKLFDGLQKIYQINEDNYAYFINFYYLYIIYHELTHVSQKAQYEKYCNKYNVFNYLYELCIVLREDEINFYKENHDIFPMEIEANNNGYLKAYQLMNYTNVPIKEIKIMYLQYLFSLLYNYKKIDAQKLQNPIELLSNENKLVSLRTIKNLLKKDELSKIERLNLGLPITLSEYKSIENKKYLNLIKTI